MKRYTVYELKTGDSVETFLTEGLALEYIKKLLNNGKYKPAELEIEEREYKPIEDGDMVYYNQSRLYWEKDKNIFILESWDDTLVHSGGQEIVFDENGVPNIEKIKEA